MGEVTVLQYTPPRGSDHYYRVRKFMRLADQDTPEGPQVPDKATRCLRIRLDLEELLEKARAAGVEVSLVDGSFCNLEASGNQFHFQATGEFDMIEYADACADLSVTNTGSMIAAGLLDEPLLREVDDSNMRKFGPGGYKDENGKWRKPLDWQPPNISKAIGLEEPRC